MKKRLSFALCLLLLLQSTVFASPLTLDLPETAAEAAETEIAAAVNETQMYEYTLASLRHEAFASVTTGADGLLTVTASGSGTLYFDNDTALDTAVYDTFVVKATNDLSWQLYFRTTTSGRMSEANKLTSYTTLKADDTYNYYVFDLSAHAAFAGEIPAANTVLMLGARGTGNTVIAQAYIASDAPEGEPTAPDEPYLEDGEYHYALSKLRSEGLSGVSKNSDGTLTVTSSGGGTLYFDNDTVLDTAAFDTFVVKATNDLSWQLYFRTSTSGGMSEANKLTSYTTLKADDTYNYYIFDLSAHAAFSGSIPAANTVLMLAVREAGSTVIEQVYIAGDAPEGMPLKGDEPYYENGCYYYALKKLRRDSFDVYTKNSDGSITVTASARGSLFIDNVEELDAALFGKLVVKATANPAFSLYFRTSESGRMSESNKLRTYREIPCAGGYKYYVYDLSQHEAYTGSIPVGDTVFMLAAAGEGSATIREIFLTGDDPVTDIRTYVYPFADVSHEGFVSYEQTDEGVSLTVPGVLALSQTQTLDCATYTHFVVCADEDRTMKLDFSTTEGGEFLSINTISSYTRVRHGAPDGFAFYVFDLSANSRYAGELNDDAFRLTFTDEGDVTVHSVYVTNDPPFLLADDVAEIRLDASSDVITTDEGTVTLTPYLLLGDGRVIRSASYATDSVCASLTKNADGSAVLTGKQNGVVTVTAYFAGTDETAKATVTVSGQNGRLAVSPYKVLCFGNSITRHAPAANLGWSGDWGMAASAEDKDYLHCLQRLFNAKYGVNQASVVYGASTHSFETAIPSTDYTNAYAAMLRRVAEEQPDVVTVQMGENVASCTQEEYRVAMTAFVKSIRATAPDAQIFLVTPFWPSGEKVAALKQVAAAENVTVVEVFLLGEERENMAYGLFENAGVQHHPGDLGMSRIADAIFEKVNRALSENEKTVYTALPQSLTLSPESASVTEAYGKVAFTAEILPQDAAQDVVWTVDNKDLAVIDENGLLTAQNDGEVTVIARSLYDESVAASVRVSISGQTKPHTVIYDKNTDDDVSGMPAPNTLAKDTFIFDPVFPSRSTYRFCGWALTPDGNAVESVEVTEDITVYAVWEKAERWTFETADYFEGFTVQNGFHTYVREGFLQATATDTNPETGNVLTFLSPTLDVPLADVYALVIRMRSTAFGGDTELSLTLHTNRGDAAFSLPVSVTEETTYACVIPVSLVNARAVGFSFAPTDTDCTVFIDEIAFEKTKSTVRYHASADEAVSSMPGDLYGDDAGTYTVSPLVPERQGYTFLGWATAADSLLLVSGGETTPGNTDLYTVWDKNDHWEMDDLADYAVSGVVLSETAVTDGVLSFTATGSDPLVVPNLRPAYEADTTSGKLNIRMKWNVSEATSAQIFFRTDAANTLSEANSGRASLASYGLAPDGFQIVTVDLSGKSGFADRLNYLRFDFIGAPGTAQIDYVRFAGSDAHIVTENGQTRRITSDDACYIVRRGGTLAPDGDAYIRRAAVMGGVDLDGGRLIVTDTLELADPSAFRVYTLDMAKENVAAIDRMYIGGEEVRIIDGAHYFLRENESVRFDRHENDTGVTLAVIGEETVYIGDENAVYQARFSKTPADGSVTWSVNREDVASIDENGVLTAYKDGEIRITAVSRYDESIYAVLDVSVRYYPFTLSVKGESDIQIDGSPITFSTVFKGKVPDKSVVWTVDNERIASIDSLGTLTPLQEGTVTVSASSVYCPDVRASLAVTLAYIPFTATVTGPDAITKSLRTTAYTFAVDDARIRDKSAFWSVDDPSIALIDEATGRLTPLENGTVTITAVSNCNPHVSASKTVELSGQDGLYTITYVTADAEHVKGMPSPARGVKLTALSDAVPVREGYLFAGWAVSDDSVELVKEVTVTGDTQVYAVWYKLLYDWPFAGSSNGFSFNNVKIKSEKTALRIQSLNNDPLMTAPVSYDTLRGRYILLKFAYSGQISVAQVYYKADGKAITEATSLRQEFVGGGLDETQTVMLDMSKSRGYTGEVTHLRFDLFDEADETLLLERICVLDSARTVSFDAGAAEGVTGMPEKAAAFFGDTFRVEATPSREGYAFAGWSRYAGDRSSVGTVFTVTDDMTLYAVWDETPDYETYPYAADSLTRACLTQPLTPDGRTLAVGTSAMRGVKVTLSYIDASGERIEWTAFTSATGYALFDDLDAVCTDAYLTLPLPYRFNEIRLTDEATAEKLIVTRSGKGSGGSEPHTYDTTVVTVESGGDYIELEGKQTPVEDMQPLERSRLEGDILFQFTSTADVFLIDHTAAMTAAGLSDDVAVFTALGTDTQGNAPSLFLSGLEINADTHRYIVFKCRQTALTDRNLSIYFRPDGVGYAESRRVNGTLPTQSDEYAMVVFDMKKNANWTGTIAGFYMPMQMGTTGTLYVDWLLFTNTVPQSFVDVEGSNERFPVVINKLMPFTDVYDDDWFADDVEDAYRRGFVQGVSRSTYYPDEGVTLAEAITLAVRLNRQYYARDAVESGEGAAWYAPYVTAAVQAGIIGENDYEDYAKPATRKDVAVLFAKALPVGWYNRVNPPIGIPDLNESDEAYVYVQRLYRAGVLTGVDETGRFCPDDGITRAEIASVIDRAALPENRVVTG